MTRKASHCINLLVQTHREIVPTNWSRGSSYPFKEGCFCTLIFQKYNHLAEEMVGGFSFKEKLFFYPLRSQKSLKSYSCTNIFLFGSIQKVSQKVVQTALQEFYSYFFEFRSLLFAISLITPYIAFPFYQCSSN